MEAPVLRDVTLDSRNPLTIEQCLREFKPGVTVRFTGDIQIGHSFEAVQDRLKSRTRLLLILSGGFAASAFLTVMLAASGSSQWAREMWCALICFGWGLEVYFEYRFLRQTRKTYLLPMLAAISAGCDVYVGKEKVTSDHLKRWGF